MSENIDVMYSDGNIKISDEVICTIAAIAVSEIDGAEVSGNAISDIVEKFGKKNYSKGIKIIKGDLMTIDINITIKFGLKIYEIAHAIQENVKKNVELMSGLAVDKVNVHVNGIVQPKTEVEETEQE